MTVQTSTGRTIHIHFVHSTHDGKTRAGAGAVRQALDADAKLLARRVTLCELSEVTDEGMNADGEQSETFNMLGQGLAVCHPKDTFSKSVGRKKSLGAAMFAAGFDYAERASVWKTYLTAFTPKLKPVIDSFCGGDPEQSSRS